MENTAGVFGGYIQAKMYSRNAMVTVPICFVESSLGDALLRARDLCAVTFKQEDGFGDYAYNVVELDGASVMLAEE